MILQFKDYQIVLEPQPDIQEIYLELSSLCNLNCRHCYRNSWSYKGGLMERKTWEKVLEEAKALPLLSRIVLGGIGEPLLHPEIKEIIAEIKKMGLKISITTNGFLLSKEMAQDFVNLGVDEIIVSIDGFLPETFAENRGADIGNLWSNLKQLNLIKQQNKSSQPEILAEMVVNKRNSQEIFKLIPRLLEYNIKVLYVSQLMPVVKEKIEDIFYRKYPDEKLLEWRTLVARASMYSGVKVLLPEMGLNTHRSCRFVEGKKVVVRFDGEVSPCYRFLHDSREYVFGREKEIRAVSFGNVNKESLAEIWTKEAFVKFRFLEHMNHYPSCPDCEWVDGCDMVWNIEEDCWGNKPSCADCLWARGLIFCP
ncbi:tungsten cofactor oxidoreductase radical SAM maturase [Carboxydothermus ferrireducens]|uniref:Tungsten cofactor oxidoreductase radical SAM maturase n=1 Tax=Carboxydothermus ferrireducens DSM 11255 TaxID=1119529 RepID=A0ABX2R673_9THEO|nr:tungsten cofactor oxidoreductase radical SAM maturase [Carboxydothermus ferrireducens]NYE56669.1 tungsten cofactor oxidoreductase radical SAM maturase [Carboxydothermus ferrireducens DSM 11255]